MTRDEERIREQLLQIWHWDWMADDGITILVFNDTGKVRGFCRKVMIELLHERGPSDGLNPHLVKCSCGFHVDGAFAIASGPNGKVIRPTRRR